MKHFFYFIFSTYDTSMSDESENHVVGSSPTAERNATDNSSSYGPSDIGKVADKNEQDEPTMITNRCTVGSAIQMIESNQNVHVGKNSNDSTVTKNADTVTSTGTNFFELSGELINLYVLRNLQEYNSKFIIKAIFDPNIKFDFKRDDIFTTNGVPITFVYHLTLFVKRTGFDQFFVQDENCWKTVNEYYLRISLPSLIGRKHYSNEVKRFLSTTMDKPHQFLFDVEFSDDAPGKYSCILIMIEIFVFF